MNEDLVFKNEEMFIGGGFGEICICLYLKDLGVVLEEEYCVGGEWRDFIWFGGERKKIWELELDMWS